MKKLRKTDVIENLTNGRAKLCQAMQIDRKLNGIKLNKKELFLTDDGFLVKAKDIGVSNRIGIKVGMEKKWRFFLKNNKFLSR